MESLSESAFRWSAAKRFHCQGFGWETFLILADEPTGALDSKTSKEVINFLKQLNEEGNTVVLITHDRNIAEEAKRVVKIHDGTIVFDGSVEEYKRSEK